MPDLTAHSQTNDALLGEWNARAAELPGPSALRMKRAFPLDNAAVRRQRDRSLQLPVLHFRSVEDGDVGVGVFP